MGGGGCSHFRAKKTYIWAKPLNFRASNGENIWATDLSPPTPMDNWLIKYLVRAY